MSWIVRTVVSLSAIALIVTCADAQYRSADEALKESARSGKPIFAISTSPTCPPCRQLKHTIHNDERVRAALGDFLVLEMESSSIDFARFQEQFPGDYFGVPMVHVISGEGETIYARSGNLPPHQLLQLLSYAASQSAATESTAADYSADLEAARVEALKGDLADALRRVAPIAQLERESRDRVIARAYKVQLEAAIDDWLDDLDQAMGNNTSRYASAYRLAKLFTQLPKGTKSRAKAIDLMRRLEASAQTRTAIMQAKQLVRARLEEDRKMCSAAITSYENVIKLGASTPSGAYAMNRIPVLRERQQMKLTAAP